jgi:hypothetical protein
MAHIQMCATITLPGRSTQLLTASPMDAENSMRACSDSFLPTDVPTNFEKSEGIFQILVQNSKNTDGNYRQNSMPPPKKYYSMFRR